MGHARDSYGSRSERAGSDQLQLPSRGTTVRVWPLPAHLRRLLQGAWRVVWPWQRARGWVDTFWSPHNRTEF